MPPKKDDKKSAKKEDPADTLANQLESERQNLVSQQEMKSRSFASCICPHTPACVELFPLSFLPRRRSSWHFRRKNCDSSGRRMSTCTIQ